MATVFIIETEISGAKFWYSGPMYSHEINWTNTKEAAFPCVSEEIAQALHTQLKLTDDCVIVQNET
mgnify:CR=1 FL=1